MCGLAELSKNESNDFNWMYHFCQMSGWGLGEIGISCLFQFLLDPSPIIGYPCHSLQCHLKWWSWKKMRGEVHILVYCLIDTSPKEKQHSALTHSVTPWRLVDLKIWELRFDQKAKLLYRYWAQGVTNILKLKFGSALLREWLQPKSLSPSILASSCTYSLLFWFSVSPDLFHKLLSF